MSVILYPHLPETFAADITFPSGEHFEQETLVYAGPNRYYFAAKLLHCVTGDAQIELEGVPAMRANITGPNARDPFRYFASIIG